MKKYVLFGNIVGIGGWQIYLDAKVSYLKENGWEVHVFCPKRTWASEEVKLNGLKEYKNNMLLELCYWPYHLTMLQQDHVVKLMTNSILSETVTDTIIIESTSIFDSLWGEILAEKLNAKHFVYLLHSHFYEISAPYVDYYSFKYNRGELAGMSIETLQSLFKGYRVIDDDKSYFFSAAGKNPISNESEYDLMVNDVLNKTKGCNYIIGAFGNLDKPHTISIYEEVLSFVEQHPKIKIAYIVIGSSFRREIELKMIEKSNGRSNFKLILVEEMYPVPEKLFKLMDVCIGSWGSARVSAIAGAKTIRLTNDTDVIPQGLIGYTLTEEPYSQYGRNGRTLYEMLDDVLIHEKYSAYEYVSPQPYPDYHEEHKKMIDFLLKSNKPKEFYNINLINPPNTKQYVKKCLISIFGIDKVNWFLNLLRKRGSFGS